MLRILLILCALLLSSGGARADSCTASMSDVVFGQVSPVADCKTGASTSFSFKAQATVTDNCFINTQALAFGPNNRVLRSAVRTVGVLSVQCTANNPYMILLNGGTVSGKPAARQMLDTATGERIDYEISGTLDGALWGDGNAGTSMIAGTGTGAIQTVRMYGKVPPQRTPAPGSYRDTVTATIYF